MKRLVITVALLTMMLLVGGKALAVTEKASGEFTVGPPSVTSVTQVGHTCFIELDAVFSFTGTLEGSAPIHFDIVQAAPCDAQGPQTFDASGTFTGTVADAAGTFTFEFHGHIDAGGNARGQLAVLSGTGELTELHGHLTLAGQAGVSGNYSGTLTL